MYPSIISSTCWQIHYYPLRVSKVPVVGRQYARVHATFRCLSVMLSSHNARQHGSYVFLSTESFLTSLRLCHKLSHRLLPTIWLWQLRQWRHKQEVIHIQATLSPLIIRLPQWVDDPILYLRAVSSCFCLPSLRQWHLQIPHVLAFDIDY